MKNRFVTLVLVATLFFTSAIPALAAKQLKRPVIEKVTTNTKSIFLDWTSISGADEYKIYYSYYEDGPFEYMATTSKSSYRDYDVNKGTRYYYKVKAVSDDYKDSKLSKWRSGKLKNKTTVTRSAPTSQTVYVTNTGSKYHRSWCHYLRQSKNAISLSSARSRGYSACSYCW